MDNLPVSIPFIVHESDMHRMEEMRKSDVKEKKRILALCIILAVCFLLSQAGWIAAWVIRENQYELVEETVEETTHETESVSYEVVQDNDNGTNSFNNNVIGNEGEVNYGTSTD